jgi:hypothetical protein
LPYFESDHVLNIAYNLLAGGSRLEHLEVPRNDEVYLDALGAVRIPDPTTAGDFCRRFGEPDVERLMEAFNETRLRVWEQQPGDFFDEAFIDADGTIAPIDGWCKRGVDLSYTGIWGYHVLVVSLANTAEPLYLVNRSGSRPYCGFSPSLPAGTITAAGGPAAAAVAACAEPVAMPDHHSAGRGSTFFSVSFRVALAGVRVGSAELDERVAKNRQILV